MESPSQQPVGFLAPTSSMWTPNTTTIIGRKSSREFSLKPTPCTSNLLLFRLLALVRPCIQLTRFALRLIHSHIDATGAFCNAFVEIVTLTTSGNRVRYIVSSQENTAGTLITRSSNAECTNICISILHFQSANVDLATRACHFGSKPEVYKATL